MALRDSRPTKSIDVKGKVCPYPALEAREALKNMKSGEILEVITDWRPTVNISLPNYCKKNNYEYDVVEEGGFWRFLIKKA